MGKAKHRMFSQLMKLTCFAIAEKCSRLSVYCLLLSMIEGHRCKRSLLVNIFSVRVAHMLCGTEGLCGSVSRGLRVYVKIR